MRSVMIIGSLFLSALAAEPTGIDRIAAYEGTWKIELENLDTPFSKAGKDSSTLRNECWRSAGFYSCNQYVNGESKALIVFTYNSKNDTYTSHPIPADGGEPGSGKLLIKGNVWTFPWEIKKDGKTVSFRVVNVFTTPATIDYRQEYSTDQIHWITTATGHEAKIPPK